MIHYVLTKLVRPDCHIYGFNTVRKLDQVLSVLRPMRCQLWCSKISYQRREVYTHVVGISIISVIIPWTHKKGPKFVFKKMTTTVYCNLPDRLRIVTVLVKKYASIQGQNTYNR